MLLLVVVSACGGASGSSTVSTATATGSVTEPVAEGSVDDLARSFVDAVVAAHGEEGGFDALIWALERGYSGNQLIRAALDGRIEADGAITDSSEDQRTRRVLRWV